MSDQYSVEKTPEAVLDYGFNWIKWLKQGDVIIAATWEIRRTDSDAELTDDDLSVVQNLPTTTHTIVWLEKGILDATYEVKVKITTQEGREDSRILYVTITYDK